MNKCLRWTIGCTLAITMAAGLAGCGSSAGSLFNIILGSFG